MTKALEMMPQAFDLTRSYIRSSYNSRKERTALESVRTFCAFIGYPRSGHSLVGSLLDAHPEVVMAHELDAFKYVAAGFSKWQVYSLLLENSRTFTEAGRISSGYSLTVPNQYQGRFTRLKVIGDKKGAGTIKRLRDQPETLDRFRKVVDTNVKFVHVTRNPFDNIATIYARKQKLSPPPSLAECADFYFDLVETVAAVRGRIDRTDLVDLQHESIIADPKGKLAELCRFVGVEADDAYLADCASIVYESPNRSRHKVAWDAALLDSVRERTARFPFLEGYTYED